MTARDIILTAALTMAAPAMAQYFFPDLYQSIQVPGVARYYLFREPKQFQQNAGAGIFPIMFQAMSPNNVPISLPSRTPGKNAVLLDGDRYIGRVLPFSTNSISIALWIKPFDLIRNSEKQTTGNGMIVQNGSGDHDGWRLYIDDWQARSVKFELGYRKGAFAVRSQHPLSIGGWNHIAATWDGNHVCLYINGMLSEEHAYSGPVTQAKKDLRIGFSGSSIGPLKMAIDSLMIFDGVLTPEFITEQLFRDVKNPAAAHALYDSMVTAWNDGDITLRCSAAQAAMNNADAPAFLRSMGAEWLIDCAIAGMTVKSELAARLPEGRELDGETQRSLGLVLADAYIRENNFPAANEVIKRLLATGESSSLERANVRAHWAQALLRSDRTAEARSQFDLIRQDTDLPPHIRAFANVSLARISHDVSDFKDAAKFYHEAANVPYIRSFLKEELEKSAKLYETSGGTETRDPEATRNRLRSLPHPSLTYYIAPGGNDNNEGTFNRPFRTLDRARDAIRAQKTDGVLPTGGVTVFLRGGTYPMTNSFVLTEIDSGSFNAPVVYTAWPGETPVLDGGFRVRHFRKVKDVDVRSRIPLEARDKVRMAKVSEQGFLGDDTQRSFGFGMRNHAVRQLFEDGVPLTRARWPNTGFVNIRKVVDPQDGLFSCKDERLAQWRWAREPMATGYWFMPWARSTLPIATVKWNEKQIRLRELPPEGMKPGARFFVENLLEEIDQPGEWYLDRVSGILYVWPVKNSWFTEFTLSQFDKPFIGARNVQELVISGLTIQNGQQHGIVLENCKNVRVVGCTVHNMGGSAMMLSKMANLRVYGNRIYSMGQGGIFVNGGDRKTLNPSYIIVENNEIWDFGREAPTGTPGIFVNGCAIEVTHNYIHDCPASALTISGNDHVIEYNVIERAVQETDDQGALDMSSDPSFRGDFIRWNIFRDIGKGPVANGQAAIRFDEGISGIVAYGNRFERACNGNYGAVHIDGGQDNAVDSNLFIGCKYGISFSPWGQSKWQDFIMSDLIATRILNDVCVRAYPYKSRYPELVDIWQQVDINNIWRNTFIGGQQDFYRRPARTDLWANQSILQIPESGTLPQGTISASFPPVDEIGLYSDPLCAPEVKTK